MRRLFTDCVIAGLLILGSTSCALAPRHDEPTSYRSDYYYYPHVGVYFHLYSGDYYYRDGRDWVRVRILPSHIHLDHRARRTLVIEGPRPYKGYKAHRKRFKLAKGFRHEQRYDEAERLHNHREHLRYRRW